MEKTVIVTGASGFIGKYVILELMKQHKSVLAIVRDEKGVERIQRFLLNHMCVTNELRFIKSDLESLTIDMFENNNYETWVHLGWGGVNREQIDDKRVHEHSLEISIQCLNLAKELQCKCFCDIGSRAEIDSTEGTLYESMENGNGLNQYGLHKLEFHKYAKEFCISNNLKYLHLRLFSVIGVGDHPWSVVMTACKKFTSEEEMSFGSCEQQWNFMDVRDVAYRICKLCEMINQMETLLLSDSGTIHIASRNSRKLKDYIQDIYMICNSNSIISFGDNKGFDSYPDIMNLEQLLPFESEIEFQDTIRWILNEEMR